ncbi:MAG TPA: aminoglycoside phosphotransferase family protein [Burkholderiales bacterium]|nr:aminoglycoside phosphotransferase family protein [Burkholderiales bacterium]
MATLATTFGTLQHLRKPGGSAPRSRAVVPGDVPSEIAAALRAMDLLAPGDLPRLLPLSISGEARVYRAEMGWGTLCLKRTEFAPTGAAEQAIAERVDTERRWLKLAQIIVPGCTPTVLGSLPSGGCLALEYLDEPEFPTWQSRLAGGRVEPWVAAELGHLTGRLHAASAHSTAVAQQLAGRAAFQALRIAPAFGRIAAAHADCAVQLERIEGELGATRITLVHGDLAPENVLCGPRGPVLIDADCAHFGDPAIDVATVLAALGLRLVAHCRLRAEYAACWDAFHGSYSAHVVWEMADRIEARAAALIPALALAAIEAGTVAGLAAATGAGRAARDAARDLLLAPPERLDALRDAWLNALAG